MRIGRRCGLVVMPKHRTRTQQSASRKTSGCFRAIRMSSCAAPDGSLRRRSYSWNVRFEMLRAEANSDFVDRKHAWVYVRDVFQMNQRQMAVVVRLFDLRSASEDDLFEANKRRTAFVEAEVEQWLSSHRPR